MKFISSCISDHRSSIEYGSQDFLVNNNLMLIAPGASSCCFGCSCSCSTAAIKT